MRLINTTTLTLTTAPSPPPPYAILSHTWSPDPAAEITLAQFTNVPHAALAQTHAASFSKIAETCRLARQRRLDWAWVDTCCIDKESSAELSEAINSMWGWYRGAAVCFVVLEDWEGGAEYRMDADARAGFRRCRWFTRGWTLQELIAPGEVEFYDRTWALRGDRVSLGPLVSDITGIPMAALSGRAEAETQSVAERMSWAAARVTTRAEDGAYCLLGLFGVGMPLLYGEGGERAFVRLQEEILRESNDMSLFAWRADEEAAAAQTHWGVLAPSAKEFAGSGGIKGWADPMDGNECAVTSKGLRVTPMPGCGLRAVSGETYVMDLKCHHRRVGMGGLREGVGIKLRQVGCDVYVRVNAHKLFKTPPRAGQDKMRVFYVGKTVTPLRSLALRESVRGAVVLSRALKVLGEEWGFAAATFDPEGHWDGQRSLFLTRGVRHFMCRVRLAREGLGATRMALECRVVGDHTFGDALGAADVEVTLEQPGSASRGGAWKAPPRLVGRVTLERLDTQPVYFVDVVDESAQRR
ncbi:HET-domain-containing protein [Staphylotrichum tortipilum]|uniref:HET-domain-containing protein n=1 Tax=Staphylotrichum tortipilum TaxID=2831512 RepID=A0AAN6MCB7_9PEZI|nr:HET-domain-containing protein [Staphylotrichum longicolle]